jgi:hypothetical protein
MRPAACAEDIPYEEWHGQHRIWFDHPHFSPEESERTLRAAFRFDYDVYGSSLLRMTDTALRGYETFARYENDPYMAKRRELLRDFAQHLRPLLPAMRSLGHNPAACEIAEKVSARFDNLLGPMTAKQRAMSWAVRAYAVRERSTARAPAIASHRASTGSSRPVSARTRPRSAA